MGVRRYDLDWIRIIAMLGVFLYHCTMFLNEWGWHVKNVPTSHNIMILSMLLSNWIMPIFFLISGISAWHALRVRKAGEYLKERVLRMLPPLALGIFVFGPPQVYVERLTNGQFDGGFFTFFPHFFDGWYAFGGNFAWMGLHLWYVLILFLFSLITLPLFRLIRTRRVAPLLWPLIPLVLLETLLDPRGPGMRDMGSWNLFVYLFLFIYGYAFDVQENVRKSGKWLVTGALATSALYIGWIFTQDFPTFGTSEYLWVYALRMLNCWLWLLSIVYIAGRWLTKSNGALAYGGEMVMPFYILHQPLIVLIGFWMRELTWSVPVKFVVLVVAVLAIVAVLYEFVVRRVGVLRFLFGMKEKKGAAVDGMGNAIGGNGARNV